MSQSGATRRLRQRKKDVGDCVDFRMPVMDDVPLHRVRRPKISNKRNRGEWNAKGAARSIWN
jgi:hypothetical protein